MIAGHDLRNRECILARVSAILTNPKRTWVSIKREEHSIAQIYIRYVAPLAAIGPISEAAGRISFVREDVLGIQHRGPILIAVEDAVLSWVTSLVSLYVFALLIAAIAPWFGGKTDRTGAFKLAAYAGTATWIAGVFRIVPFLVWLWGLGILYSAYLLMRGLPHMLSVKGDRALACAVTVILVGGSLLVSANAVTESLLARLTD